MKLSSFKFKVPQELIALHPVAQRDECRLMVIHRDSGKIEHRTFKDVSDYLDEGDALVLNDTKVFPAKMLGSKEKTGAKIEVFLLRELHEETHLWDTLVEPARKIRVGNKLSFGDDELIAEVLDNTTSRGRTLKFLFDGTTEELYAIFQQLGSMPIPRLLGRDIVPEDAENYQTVYADKVGSVAAPAAGLHFTQYLLKSMELKGVMVTPITLHVGLSMLAFSDVEDLTKYKLNSEPFFINEQAANTVNTALDQKKRVCAVGASTLKALESSVSTTSRLRPEDGWTNKFIFPPYDFKVCNALITNFHLPGSVLLMNSMAFGGYELMMEAYNIAIKEEYRFFAYGDAMIII